MIIVTLHNIQWHK